MAYLELNREALAHNYQFLADHFHKNQKHWGVVTKVLCGHKTYLEEVLKLHTGTVFDSRLSNLKAIRNCNLKPVRSISNLHRNASFQNCLK